MFWKRVINVKYEIMIENLKYILKHKSGASKIQTKLLILVAGGLQ